MGWQKTILLFFPLALSIASPIKAASPLAVAQRELKRVRSRSAEEPLRWIEEARLLYYHGKYSNDKSTKQKFFDEGQQLAWKARKAKPKDLGAILWWAANRGELAEIKHNLVALGYLKEIEAALLELKEIDPDYFFRAADRVLGRIYQRAPSFVSIGSKSKAEAHFKEAMRTAGHYPCNRIFYANFLLEQGDKKGAKRLARSVLNAPNLNKYPIEKYDWISMAQEIMKATKDSPTTLPHSGFQNPKAIVY